MANAVRVGSPESPTTAQVSQSSSMKRTDFGVLPGGGHTDDSVLFRQRGRHRRPTVESMTPGRFPRALVSAAVATALASAGLVTVTTAPAAADPAAEPSTSATSAGSSGTSRCRSPSTWSTFPRGSRSACPCRTAAWDVEASFALPDLLVAILIGLTGSITAATDELDLLLDGSPVPVDLTSALEALPVAEPLDLPMSGSNREFVPGDARRAGADPARRPTTSISPAPSAYRCSRRTASWRTTRPPRSGPSTSSSRRRR